MNVINMKGVLYESKTRRESDYKSDALVAQMWHKGGKAILRLPDVVSRIGLSKSTIYFRISKSEFPQPIRLGERAVGWLESDIEAWLTERVRVSRSSASSNKSRRKA